MAGFLPTLRRVRDWAVTLITRRGRIQPLVLLSLLTLVLAIWGFSELTDEVFEGETQTFDEWMIRALRDPANPARPRGPSWMAEVGRDLTALGGVTVLTLMTLAVLGYLLLTRNHRTMIFVLIATVGGTALTYGMKFAFDRPRPELVPHLSHVYTSSFPSGHSMMSAAVYLTLATLLSTVLRRRRLKVYVLCIALLTSFLVGLSRVYMGVHYPTDVLGGWAVGLAWALLCWLVDLWLQRRGIVEPEAAERPNDATPTPVANPDL